MKCLCKALLKVNRVMCTSVRAGIHLYMSHPGLLEMNLLKNRPQLVVCPLTCCLYQAHVSLHSLLMKVHTHVVGFFTWSPSSCWNYHFTYLCLKHSRHLISRQKQCVSCGTQCHATNFYLASDLWLLFPNQIDNLTTDNNCLSVNKTLCTSRTKAKVLQLKGNYRVQRTKLHSSLHL